MEGVSVSEPASPFGVVVHGGREWGGQRACGGGMDSPLKHSCLFRTAPAPPVLWPELCGTLGADHSPTGLLWAPIHGFLPTLAGLLAARLCPWPGISECPGGCPGLAKKDFGYCGLRSYFCHPECACGICCPDRPRAGRGRARLRLECLAWELRSRLESGGWSASSRSPHRRGLACDRAGRSPSRPWPLGSERKVTVRFSVPTPSLWRNSSKMVSV